MNPPQSQVTAERLPDTLAPMPESEEQPATIRAVDHKIAMLDGEMGALSEQQRFGLIAKAMLDLPQLLAVPWVTVRNAVYYRANGRGESVQVLDLLDRMNDLEFTKAERGVLILRQLEQLFGMLAAELVAELDQFFVCDEDGYYCGLSPAALAAEKLSDAVDTIDAFGSTFGFDRAGCLNLASYLMVRAGVPGLLDRVDAPGLSRAGRLFFRDVDQEAG